MIPTLLTLALLTLAAVCCWLCRPGSEACKPEDEL